MQNRPVCRLTLLFMKNLQLSHQYLDADLTHPISFSFLLFLFFMSLSHYLILYAHLKLNYSLSVCAT